MTETPLTRRANEPPTLTAEEIGEIQKSHDEHDPHQHFDWDHIAEIHDHRGLLLAEVARLRREAKRLRAERDTLLLDAHAFVQWFNASYPDPSTHPDHPWCVINDRLNAHADTLAALDAAMAKTDKEDGR